MRTASGCAKPNYAAEGASALASTRLAVMAARMNAEKSGWGTRGLDLNSG